MNDNFTDQKEKLVSLSHEINLLRQQVNFLLRNEKPLGLLDLDVLMNRTHTIYDTLCAINLGENADDEDMDFDPEAFTEMLGAMMKEENLSVMEHTDSVENEEEAATLMVEEITQPKPEEVTLAEPEPTFEPESEPEPEPEPELEPVPEPEPEPAYEPESEQAPLPMTETPKEGIQPNENETEISGTNSQEAPLGDEFGFFFRFEDTPSVTEAEETLDDAGFEPHLPETLGDKMLQEDHSLAAKLQQNPVRDLKSVIGINDKFLFVNELFGGSMEKYNKSIENLNDLKTLNGAMIYLNELKIELQWNSSNEAYQKLSDLVRRKFE